MKTNANRKYIEELAHKYKHDTLTSKERMFFDDWYRSQLAKERTLPEEFATDYLELQTRILFKLNDQIDRTAQIEAPAGKRLWTKIAVAASLIFALFTGGYIILQQQHPRQQNASVKNQDILPGENKAVLTLANGTKVDLNAAGNGRLAEQGEISISKTADGEIVYSAEKLTGELEGAYNTISTPRGGRYRLTLADGTKVWLNAASSIRYPVSFSTRERKVETNGQLYFEVAHDQSRPFRVVSDGQTVEVLGTHFDVNSYPDESYIVTTLLEGSVKVYNIDPKKFKILSPGKMAKNDKSQILISAADNEAAVAWKNNEFQFTGSDIQALMREFSRWYDVDVEYLGEIPKINEFTGKISRNVKASRIFELLKRYHINAKIDGKKVIVSADRE